MKYLLIKSPSGWVNLYQNDELNSFPANQFFFDLASNIKFATRFTEFNARQFLKTQKTNGVEYKVFHAK